MTKPALFIRDATAADEAAWRGLWAQYLAFYKVELADDVTDHTWARILDPSSRVAMRVAEVNGVLAGFAIHHFHDSTWVKTADCYLEDLFLDATYRGRGIGRALIDDLIAIATAKGWSRLYWHTDRDNVTARKLYDTYAPEDGHVRYRLKLC
ncbi:GNAT family N-acetyltransferase [Rhizobium sp. 'Codium 1']|uniref:GNAT family N-acetyltransferase n=1 Tax=Rhizobium sp. 'Codium 1' TaxID=2940484 RepID=UPI001E316AC7|nr:GNAT family N-acetyltransferase [Rhizobium sp. 'Codium 1']MCC8931757.1 GNAT family N-acetyltransferase [Rhizobium sp. 'Codium 1']